MKNSKDAKIFTVTMCTKQRYTYHVLAKNAKEAKKKANDGDFIDGNDGDASDHYNGPDYEENDMEFESTKECSPSKTKEFWKEMGEGYRDYDDQ